MHHAWGAGSHRLHGKAKAEPKLAVAVACPALFVKYHAAASCSDSLWLGFGLVPSISSATSNFHWTGLLVPGVYVTVQVNLFAFRMERKGHATFCQSLVDFML